MRNEMSSPKLRTSNALGGGARDELARGAEWKERRSVEILLYNTRRRLHSCVSSRRRRLSPPLTLRPLARASLRLGHLHERRRPSLDVLGAVPVLELLARQEERVVEKPRPPTKLPDGSFLLLVLRGGALRRSALRRSARRGAHHLRDTEPSASSSSAFPRVGFPRGGRRHARVSRRLGLASTLPRRVGGGQTRRCRASTRGGELRQGIAGGSLGVVADVRRRGSIARRVEAGHVARAAWCSEEEEEACREDNFRSPVIWRDGNY